MDCGAESRHRDNKSYAQIDLDARDCMADDWYLVNAAGEVVNAA